VRKESIGPGEGKEEEVIGEEIVEES